MYAQCTSMYRLVTIEYILMFRSDFINDLIAFMPQRRAHTDDSRRWLASLWISSL